MGTPQLNLAAAASGPNCRQGQGQPAQRPRGHFSSPIEAQRAMVPGLTAVAPTPGPCAHQDRLPLVSASGPGNLWQLPLGLSGRGLSWSTVGAVIDLDDTYAHCYWDPTACSPF